jgi:hypothetical protein
MYSYERPVMLEPFGWVATGTLMVRLLLPAGAEGSQPLQARL